MGPGNTIQVVSQLGCLSASRRTGKLLIIYPSTMLSRWLSNMDVWALGILRVLIHLSTKVSSSRDSENGSPYGTSLGKDRSVSAGLLHSLERPVLAGPLAEEGKG